MAWVIAGIFALITIGTVILFIKTLKYIIEIYYNLINPPSIKEMKQWTEENVKEKYPCTLLLFQQQSDFEGLAFDFSEYENKQIIGLTNFVQTADGFEDQVMVLPHQEVWKLDDGIFYWNGDCLFEEY